MKLFGKPKAADNNNERPQQMLGAAIEKLQERKTMVEKKIESLRAEARALSKNNKASALQKLKQVKMLDRQVTLLEEQHCQLVRAMDSEPRCCHPGCGASRPLPDLDEDVCSVVSDVVDIDPDLGEIEAALHVDGDIERELAELEDLEELERLMQDLDGDDVLTKFAGQPQAAEAKEPLAEDPQS
mmetsp:Transcript_49618/g.107820  ORF Transcript_49618/g.107820 Transcript_49618/m.107820 type:complete len:185 (+) Transcript_49618:3-557(+)